jgi:tripartite-type tricarboxylate transporter receptor subunit TctC
MVRLIAPVLCSIFVVARARRRLTRRGRWFILPFPPGGGTDILGRVIAERLSANLGQPVVTENRGGAGGNVGAEAAAHSAPDGYTIVLVAPSLAISPSLYSKLNYDPVKDLAPVSLVATVPNVMITNPSVEAKNLQEFIALALARPGAMNYGSGGAGTSNHLAGELFNIVTGAKLVHVPYKGVNLAMQGVLAGEIHLVFIGIPAALPHIKAASCALALVAPRALARAAGGADRRRSGAQGLRGDHLVRGNGPCRHAAPYRHAPQRGARENHAHAGREGAPRRHGHRPAHQHARGVRRLPQAGNREVGRRRAQGESEGRLKQKGEQKGVRAIFL